MDKDIPEIDLVVSHTPVTAKTRKLKEKWTIVQSDWMVWIDGIHKYANWLNMKTNERIEVDYDTACDYMLGYPGAQDELKKLLPKDKKYD